MRKSILEKYLDELYQMKELDADSIYPFAKELERRHRGGWRIPTSCYVRCKELLIYKESLERNSPYYVDLLKIENKDDLHTVLLDIYRTIKIR